MRKRTALCFFKIRDVYHMGKITCVLSGRMSDGTGVWERVDDTSDKNQYFLYKQSGHYYFDILSYNN